MSERLDLINSLKDNDNKDKEYKIKMENID